MRALRLAAVALAILACVWFGLGVRQAHDVSAANAIINDSNSVSARQAAHARALLDSAATLNPDIQVRILRSQLALDEGHYEQAIVIARSATRSEPRNVNTWLALSVAQYDAGRSSLAAVAKLVALDPQLAHGTR